LPGATAARQLVVGRALEYLDKLTHEATGDRELQLELAEAYLKIGDIQGKPYTSNLGDSAGAIRSYTKAAEIASAWVPKEQGTARAEARDKLVRTKLALASVQARAGQLQHAKENNAHALDVLERLATDAPDLNNEWQRWTAEGYLGLGDAIQAGNHERRDRELHKTAVEHYERALPPAEELVAADPHNTANLRLLAKVCARIAGLLPGSRGDTAESFEAALSYHARKTELQEKAVALEPDNVHLRRNLAGGLVATAFTRMTAGRDLEQALADCERALAMQEPIASADRADKEAQQDLSYTAYITGRLHQLLGNLPAAAERYRQAIKVLEPLVAADPGNVETSFDLRNAQQRLKEVDHARRSASPLH
jgi:tetratricopeptide (TPR) repeat protein